MRICSRCKIEKPLSEFNRNNTPKARGYQYQCRLCQSDIAKIRYAEDRGGLRAQLKRNRRAIEVRNRQFVRAYKAAHPCVDCGEDDVDVLDFDHVRGRKVAPVSRLVRMDTSIERITAEIAKCEVVCANHHRRRTARRRALALVTSGV